LIYFFHQIYFGGYDFNKEHELIFFFYLVFQIFLVGGVFATLMPKEDYFSKALYTFDIGQNDFAAGLGSNMTLQQVNATVPDIVNTFIENIKVSNTLL
jgi:hypothetical protein